MDLVKEFYVRRFGEQMGRAFSWRIFTLPKLERLTSVTGTVCLTVLLINSLCWTLFTFVLFQALLFQNSGNFAQLSLNPLLYVPALLVLGITVFLHMRYFRRKLRKGLADALEDAHKTLTGRRMVPEKWQV